MQDCTSWRGLEIKRVECLKSSGPFVGRSILYPRMIQKHECFRYVCAQCSLMSDLFLQFIPSRLFRAYLILETAMPRYVIYFSTNTYPCFLAARFGACARSFQVWCCRFNRSYYSTAKPLEAIENFSKIHRLMTVTSISLRSFFLTYQCFWGTGSVILHCNDFALDCLKIIEYNASYALYPKLT